jgi:hypothetical protein
MENMMKKILFLTTLAFCLGVGLYGGEYKVIPKAFSVIDAEAAYIIPYRDLATPDLMCQYFGYESSVGHECGTGYGPCVLPLPISTGFMFVPTVCRIDNPTFCKDSSYVASLTCSDGIEEEVIPEDERIAICPSGSVYNKITNLCVMAPESASATVCPKDSYYDYDSNRCFTLPSCTDDGVYDDVEKSCKKTNMLHSSSRNGNYFIYLKKDGSKDAYFLTPLSYGNLYQCQKETFTCKSTGALFNSRSSCDRFCKTIGSVTDADMVPGYTQGECGPIGSISSLTGVSYATRSGCEDKCFETNNVTIPAINMNFRISSSTLTDVNKVTIKRYTTTGKVIDYSYKVKNTDPVAFGFNNSGIMFNGFKKGEKVIITYQSSYVGGVHKIGVAEWDQNYVNTAGSAAMQDVTSNLGTCKNILAFYPNNRMVLDVDFDLDSSTDKSFTVGDTFLCQNNKPMTVRQEITFTGKSILVDSIDQLGNKEREEFTYEYQDSGVCNLSEESTNQFQPIFGDKIPADYLNGKVSGVYKNEKGVTIGDVDSLVDIVYPGAMESLKLGIAKIDISKYVGGMDPDDSKALYEEIEKNKNIPIPFWDGVYPNDYFYTLLKNSGIGETRQLDDFKIYMGYGYSPGEDCRVFEVDPAIISSSKSVDMKELLEDGSCPDGYNENAGVCIKPLVTSITVDKVTICRPWWEIKRMYVCDGAEGSGSITDSFSFGYPRWIETCTETVENYKNLSIDTDGNIISAQ